MLGVLLNIDLSVVAFKGLNVEVIACNDVFLSRGFSYAEPVVGHIEYILSDDSFYHVLLW